MNRSDFQQLAELHLEHAKDLRDAKLDSGAYYIAGYAVECALKACISRRTNQFDFPDKKTADLAWTHNLPTLAQVSGLQANFDDDQRHDQTLKANWQVVNQWRESSRYEAHLQHDAENLLSAISDPDHGVLSCIKRYW